jgi:hypothetical protein
MNETPLVVAVCAGAEHGITKESCDELRLIVGRGVEGDAHFGEKVQHRSRAARDPELRNLRQIHLIRIELLTELCAKGFEMQPCSLGENITRRGLGVVAMTMLFDALFSGWTARLSAIHLGHRATYLLIMGSGARWLAGMRLDACSR